MITRQDLVASGWSIGIMIAGALYRSIDLVLCGASMGIGWHLGRMRTMRRDAR